MAFIKKIKKGNNIYAIEVEGYRDKDGRVKHKYKRYLGKVGGDGKVLPSSWEVKVDEVYRFGLPAIVSAVIKELDLKNVFAEYTDELASMMLMQVVDPSSVSKMLHRIKNIDPEFTTPLTRKRVDAALDHLQENKELIEQKLYDRLKGICNEETLFYDITSIALNGIRSRLAKIGYPEFEPQFNVGLCLESSHGFPLFHEIFPGNISHKKTLQQIMDRLKSFDRQNVVLVFDAGVTTMENLKTAKKMDFEVITRIPLYPSIKKIAFESKTTSPKDLIQLTNSKVYVKEIGWMQGKLLICFNERVRVSIKEKRIDEVQTALEKRRRGYSIKEGIKKYLIKENGKWQINYEKLEDAEKYDGLYALYCSLGNIPKEKIVKTYFRKDRIEKSFQQMKCALEIKPVRFQTDKRIRAHIVLCHLAYLITTYIETKVKEKGLDLTLDSIKEIQENIYKVYFIRGKKRMQKVSSLAPQQEEILRIFNLLS